MSQCAQQPDIHPLSTVCSRISPNHTASAYSSEITPMSKSSPTPGGKRWFASRRQAHRRDRQTAIRNPGPLGSRTMDVSKRSGSHLSRAAVAQQKMVKRDAASQRKRDDEHEVEALLVRGCRGIKCKHNPTGKRYSKHRRIQGSQRTPCQRYAQDRHYQGPIMVDP